MNSKLPPLIGLSGKAGSGKSLVADYLASRHRYYPLPFAEPLKEAVGIAFGFSQEQLYGDLKEVMDPRIGRSPRWCLQHFGSAFREVWPEVWVEAWRDNLRLFHVDNGRRRPVVVPDVRLANEAAALKDLGGVLWRLERPGHAGALNGIPGHCSEVELDDYRGWAAVIVAPTKEMLFSQVDYLLGR